MADNESGIDFEVTLGGDIDEKAEADAQKKKNGNGDNANFDRPISESKNEGRVGVREFYEKIVEPVVGSITGQGQEFAIQFAEKLKNGKVPAVDIYNVAGMKVYSLSTEDDRKRISSWCDEWTKEAQKLGNREQEKRENLSFAIPEFRNLFMHQSLCEELRNSLLDIAWVKLDALINATCSDKIVELEEVCSIQDAAVELGLLDLSSGESRRDFKERLAEKTKELGAEIDTIEEAFKRFYNEKKEKDPTITIDTNFSKTELVVEFQRLKKFHVKLFPEDSDKFNDLEEFMNSCGIVLKDKIQYFEEDYFDDFKKHVKLSQLQQSIYKGTKKLAMCKEYGFSETDWEKFEKKHHIKPISDEELVRMNQRNGIIKNSLKVGGVVLGLVVMFIAFRVCFPNQYTYIVSQIAPDEEQKALNIARQTAKAELERKIAQEKAEREMALAEERAAREREKYEEEKRREEEIRNSQPKTYTVGIGSGYDFQNLQEAVDASKDTDTIILSPGVYKSTANIGKRITITSGQGTVAAIKSKYFASKDVPVIVLDSGKPSKITADVKISGVVFTGNKSLSFTSFTGYQENSATYDRRYSANVAKSGLKWTKFSEDPMSSSYKSLLSVSANVDFEGVAFVDSSHDGVTLITGNHRFDSCHFANMMNNAVLVLGKSFAKFDSPTICYTVCGSGIKAKENSTIEISNAEFMKCHNGIYTSGNSKGTAASISLTSSTIAAIRSCDNSAINYTGVKITESRLSGAAGIAIDGASASTFTDVDVQKTFAGAVVAGKSNPSFENCKFLETSKYGIVFTENAGGALKNADITGSVRGIIVEKKAAPLITNTKVHHNEEAGVTFYGEAKGHLENVESYSNTTGFSINDSTYPVITHSKAYSNNTGFLSSENNKAVIADCDSFRNNASGFAVYEDGSAAFKAQNIIDGCRFYENKWDGISIRGAVSVAITNTESQGNQFAAGLSATETAAVSVKNSRFTGNKFGAKIGGRVSLSASDSSFDKNSDSGAFMDGNSKVSFERCTFDNNLDGFYSAANAYITASDCSMSKNSNIGLSIRDTSTGEFKDCLNRGNEKKNMDNKSKAGKKPQFDNSFSISLKNLF